MENHSRYLIFFLLLILLSFQHLSSQQQAEQKAETIYKKGAELILNPKSPLSKNAGRVLKLEEMLRITDTGREFYFRNLRKLESASNGSIFIADINQLLKFTKEGKFLKNLIKQGQGPGEIEGLNRFCLHKDEIYVSDNRKIVRMDIEGNLTEEIKTAPRFFEDITDNWFIFSKANLPPPKERTYKLADYKNYIMWLSRKDEAEERSHIFLARMFVGGRLFLPWDKFIWVLDRERDYIYASHSREYQIELLDLNKGKVIRSFKRDYSRIKYKMDEREKDIYKKYNPPRKKYESDILNLFISDGLLWVYTSTVDKRKGVLIDVFNSEGKYLDNFYINVSGSILAIRGDSIFIKETDEQENIHVVLYKIMGF